MMRKFKLPNTSSFNKNSLEEFSSIKNKNSQTIQELSLWEDFEKRIETINSKIDGIELKLKQDDYYKEKIENKIEASSSKSLAMLAVFSTVFTFISINTNIFTKVESLFQAAGIMIISALLSIIILGATLTILESFSNEITSRTTDAIKAILKPVIIILIILLIFAKLSDFTITKENNSIIIKGSCNQEAACQN